MSTPPNARVLLVDDDPNFRGILEIYLRMYHFHVVTARHGLDALMQYQVHKGDFVAVITDVHMPEMSGLEFLHQIRKLGYSRRVVLMSGHISPDELKSFAELSIGGFFRKPFEANLLVTMLRMP